MSKTEVNYECILELETGETFNDINFVSFIKTPMFKISSFSLIKLYMTKIAAIQITNDIADHNYPKIKLTIWECETEGNKKITPILTITLLCVMIKKERKSAPEDNKDFVQLILVHPILFFMSRNNIYNTILENVTGQEAIEAYETFIKGSYGDIFQFEHIGIDNINDFKYEQILIKSPNDLIVPTSLIQNNKPLHNHNWYFFDSFSFSGKKTNEIICFWMSLFDKNKLTQFDVTKYPDTRDFIKFVYDTPVADIDSMLNKKGETAIFINHEGIYEKNEVTSSNLISSSKKSEEKIENMEDREIKLTETNITSEKSFDQSSEHITVFVPDYIPTAKERYKICKEFFKSLDSFQFFEISQCSPSFPEFGQIYNLDVDDRSSYMFTPYSIINIFNRKNMQEPYLAHMSRFACIKYKEQE